MTGDSMLDGSESEADGASSALDLEKRDLYFPTMLRSTPGDPALLAGLRASMLRAATSDDDDKRQR
jgi:hypothetical protein